jgi:hypothetical protein
VKVGVDADRVIEKAKKAHESGVVLRFPRVKQRTDTFAIFEDGSFVNYQSELWRDAQSIKFDDDEQGALWEKLPDSWKAELMRWETHSREKYMRVLLGRE